MAESEAEAIRLKREAEQERERRLALDQVAARYGVSTDRAGHKKQRLQRSFLTKPCDEALSSAEIEYCAGMPGRPPRSIPTSDSPATGPGSPRRSTGS